MKKNEENFLSAIEKFCEGYVKYNNIEGYTNQKKYTISLSKENIINDNKIYKLKIKQGQNYPKTILENSLITEKNLNKNIDDIILKLIANEDFSYTSFNNVGSKLNSFNINFNNNVVMEFKINSEEELKRYKIIDDIFKTKIIRAKINNRTTNMDELQQEKAQIKINLASSYANLLKNKEVISSKYLMLLKNNYSEQRQCYVYNLQIINITENEIIFNTNFSIADKKNIKNAIQSLLNAFSNKETYIYSSISDNTSRNEFRIVTNANVDLEVIYSNDLEDKIYPNFKKELDSKNIKVKKLVK